MYCASRRSCDGAPASLRSRRRTDARNGSATSGRGARCAAPARARPCGPAVAGRRDGERPRTRAEPAARCHRQLREGCRHRLVNGSSLDPPLSSKRPSAYGSRRRGPARSSSACAPFAGNASPSALASMCARWSPRRCVVRGNRPESWCCHRVSRTQRAGSRVGRPCSASAGSARTCCRMRWMLQTRAAAQAERSVEVTVTARDEEVSSSRWPTMVGSRCRGAAASVREPFFTTKPDGLGLGLALCRTIVDAWGGRLTPDNDAKGRTVMRLWLPNEPQGASENA